MNQKVTIRISSYSAYQHNHTFAFVGQCISVKRTVSLSPNGLFYTNSQEPAPIFYGEFDFHEIPLLFQNVNLMDAGRLVTSTYRIKVSTNPNIYSTIPNYFNDALSRSGISRADNHHFEETTLLVDTTGTDNPYQYMIFTINTEFSRYVEAYREFVINELANDLKYETNVLVPFMRGDVLEQIVLQEKGYDVIEQAPQQVIEYIEYLKSKGKTTKFEPVYMINTMNDERTFLRQQENMDLFTFSLQQYYPQLLAEKSQIDRISDLFKRFHGVLFKVSNPIYENRPVEAILSHVFGDSSYDTIVKKIEQNEGINQPALMAMAQTIADFSFQYTPLSLLPQLSEMLLRRTFNTVDYLSGRDERTLMEAITDPQTIQSALKDSLTLTNAIFQYKYLNQPLIALMQGDSRLTLDALKKLFVYGATTMSFDTFSKTVGPYMVDKLVRGGSRELQHYTGENPALDSYLENIYKSQQVQTAVDYAGYLGAYGAALLAYKFGYLDQNYMRSINNIAQTNLVAGVLPNLIGNAYRFFYYTPPSDVQQLFRAVDAGLYAYQSGRGLPPNEYWGRRVLQYMFAGPEIRQQVYNTGTINENNFRMIFDQVIQPKLRDIINTLNLQNFIQPNFNINLNQFAQYGVEPRYVLQLLNDDYLVNRWSEHIARLSYAGNRDRMGEMFRGQDVQFERPNYQHLSSVMKFAGKYLPMLLLASVGIQTYNNIRQKPRDAKLFKKLGYSTYPENYDSKQLPLIIEQSRRNFTQQRQELAFENYLKTQNLLNKSSVIFEEIPRNPLQINQLGTNNKTFEQLIPNEIIQTNQAIQTNQTFNPLVDKGFELKGNQTNTTSNQGYFNKFGIAAGTFAAGLAGYLYNTLVNSGASQETAGQVANDLAIGLAKAEYVHRKGIGRTNILRMEERQRQNYNKFIHKDFINRLIEEEEELPHKKFYRQRKRNRKNYGSLQKRIRL